MCAFSYTVVGTKPERGHQIIWETNWQTHIHSSTTGNKHTCIVCSFLCNMSSGQQCSGSSFVLEINSSRRRADGHLLFSMIASPQHSSTTPKMFLQPRLPQCISTSNETNRKIPHKSCWLLAYILPLTIFLWNSITVNIMIFLNYDLCFIPPCIFHITTNVGNMRASNIKEKVRCAIHKSAIMCPFSMNFACIAH